MRTLKPIGVLLLTLASFWLGYHVQKAPAQVVKWQTVYLPITQPLKNTKYIGEQINKISAAIPASALRRVASK